MRERGPDFDDALYIGWLVPNRFALSLERLSSRGPVSRLSWCGGIGIGAISTDWVTDGSSGALRSRA